jgi:hypothetical protein
MRLITLSAALGLVLVSATQAAAQDRGFRALEVTPSAGYMFFGDYLEGPFGTRLTNASGPLYGVQLDLNLSRNIGLYGHVGIASSDLEVGLPILGGLSVASSDVMLYDGGIELRAPMSGGGARIVPFLQAGAGAIRHEIDNGIVNIDATNTAFNGGVGLDVRFTPAIGLRLLAKDYFGKFDFEEATTFDIEGKTAHNFGLSVGLKVGF